LLYSKQLEDSFNDITIGNNKCCTLHWKQCCNVGWNAATGWDPVSGLGSLDFKKFLKIVTEEDEEEIAIPIQVVTPIQVVIPI